VNSYIILHVNSASVPELWRFEFSNGAFSMGPIDEKTTMSRRRYNGVMISSRGGGVDPKHAQHDSGHKSLPQRAICPLIDIFRSLRNRIMKLECLQTFNIYTSQRPLHKYDGFGPRPLSVSNISAMLLALYYARWCPQNAQQDSGQ